MDAAQEVEPVVPATVEEVATPEAAPASEAAPVETEAENSEVQA